VDNAHFTGGFMINHSSHFNKKIRMVVLLPSLLLILVACGNIDGSKTTTIKSANQAIVSTSLTNTIKQTSLMLDTVPCPSSVSSPSHWDAVVGTQPEVNAVQSVTCANLEGDSSLQALVTVGYSDSSALNAYIYTNITSANPTQIFSLQGLPQGSASISANNTIITTEVDNGSTITHQYAWSASADQFVQIS
jgi:hypothetical protein